jgi:hypothetical protein
MQRLKIGGLRKVVVIAQILSIHTNPFKKNKVQTEKYFAPQNIACGVRGLKQETTENSSRGWLPAISEWR